MHELGLIETWSKACRAALLDHGPCVTDASLHHVSCSILVRVEGSVHGTGQVGGAWMRGGASSL